MKRRSVAFNDYVVPEEGFAWIYRDQVFFDFDDALHAVTRELLRLDAEPNERWFMGVWRLSDSEDYVERLKLWLHRRLDEFATDESVRDRIFGLEGEAIRRFERLHGQPVFRNITSSGLASSSLPLLSAVDALATVFVSEVGPRFPTPIEEVFVLDGAASDLVDYSPQEEPPEVDEDGEADHQS